MNLEQLVPQEGRIKLVNPMKEYVLRPFNLGDEVWVRKTFGDKVAELFNPENLDLEGLSRIAFHQLEDKSDFVEKEIITVNEEGKEVVESIGGYKLLMSRIKGMAHKIDLVWALNETLGASRPDIDIDKKVKKKKVAKK